MTTKTRFEMIGPSLARQVREVVDDSGKRVRYEGKTIYARVRDKGRRTWKSTETETPKDARTWLKKWKQEKWMLANGIEPKGVTLQRQRVTVAEIVDAYTQAQCPSKKNQPKKLQTIQDETGRLRPVRSFFGDTPAAGLTLHDCDKYRDWRKDGKFVTTFKVRGHSQTRKTKGGNRAVDLELQSLSNALTLAVRRGLLKVNPLVGRGRYTCADDVRHCREVAPTPEGLQAITGWLRGRNETAVADVVQFLAYTGLRIGEALPLTWDKVNLGEGLVNVQREKRGVNPWVAITPELETMLHEMSARATGELLFPSPFDGSKPRDASAVRQRLNAATGKLGLPHVTPHGLRSYYVTQARQSGLTDAEIAMLIGDKTGPAIIAQTYGDLRPDHLLAQARLIRHKVAPADETASGKGFGSFATPMHRVAPADTASNASH